MAKILIKLRRRVAGRVSIGPAGVKSWSLGAAWRARMACILARGGSRVRTRGRGPSAWETNTSRGSGCRIEEVRRCR